MLIDRKDDVINLCEIKFSRGKYEIKKNYANELQDKVTTFQTKAVFNKPIFTVMITTEGLVDNTYARDIQNQVIAEDLFK